MATPLPSELVRLWLQYADDLFAADNPGPNSLSEFRIRRTASSAIFRQCARELQASLEAMQKEGGE